MNYRPEPQTEAITSTFKMQLDFSPEYSYLNEEDFYGDPNSIRSAQETIIRAVALQLAVVIAFGHLLSLQQISSHRALASVLSVVTCVLFPTVPVVQFLRNVFWTATTLYRKGGLFQHWTFYLSSVLGMHAVKASRPSETAPLVHFDPTAVRRTRMRYGVRFVGRIFVLLVLLAQLVGTVVLWVRRAVVYPGPYRLWGIDNRNLEVASGAIIVVLLSMGIQCELQLGRVAQCESGFPAHGCRTRASLSRRTSLRNKPSKRLAIIQLLSGVSLQGARHHHVRYYWSSDALHG